MINMPTTAPTNRPLFTRPVVTVWCQRHKHEHKDRHTGEVNATALAEACAQAFNVDHVLDDETHWIWDVAADATDV